MFIIAKKETGNNPTYTSRVDHWILVQCISTMDYYTAVKMDGPRYPCEQKDESQKCNVKGKRQVTEGPYTMSPLLSSWKTGKVKLYIHLW